MREWILNIIISMGVVFMVLLIVTAILILATPKCDEPNGKFVAFKMNTALIDYQVGTCQNGRVSYENVDILKLIKKLKEE